jgi:putative SOS response-associated peptidase YedK
MCGRYTLRVTGHDLQHELGLDEEPKLEPRYNLAPTQAAPVVTTAAPRRVTLARWGMIPHWAKDATIGTRMINARSETILSRNGFKESFERRRCLVPADGFYEWKHAGKTKQPMHIGPPKPGLMTFAGLWDTWRAPNGLDLVSFTIITTAANAQIAPIHDRMPAFLDPAGRALWLDPATTEGQLLELLKPWSGEAFHIYPVSSVVGSVEVDDPRCVEPAKQVQLDLL